MARCRCWRTTKPSSVTTIRRRLPPTLSCQGSRQSHWLIKTFRIIAQMSPGGHAATTVVACAATAYLSGSLPLATAVALGGFFIDIDHAVDYVLFDGQRDLRPTVFLRYYLEARAKV